MCQCVPLGQPYCYTCMRLKKRMLKYLNCVTQKGSEQTGGAQCLKRLALVKELGGREIWNWRVNSAGVHSSRLVSRRKCGRCVFTCAWEEGHTNTCISSKAWIWLLAKTMWRTVLHSLCLIHFMLREGDSECCKIYPVWSAQRLSIFTGCGCLLQLSAVSAAVFQRHLLNAFVALLTHTLDVWLVGAVLNHLQMKFWGQKKKIKERKWRQIYKHTFSSLENPRSDRQDDQTERMSHSLFTRSAVSGAAAASAFLVQPGGETPCRTGRALCARLPILT